MEQSHYGFYYRITESKGDGNDCCGCRPSLKILSFGALPTTYTLVQVADFFVTQLEIKLHEIPQTMTTDHGRAFKVNSGRSC